MYIDLDMCIIFYKTVPLRFKTWAAEDFSFKRVYAKTGTRQTYLAFWLADIINDSEGPSSLRGILYRVV